MSEANTSQNIKRRRYGSEADVEALTGFSRRTLQKDRMFGRRFPFSRVGGKVLYDLDEIEDIIRASRVEVRSPQGVGV